MATSRSMLENIYRSLHLSRYDGTIRNPSTGRKLSATGISGRNIIRRAIDKLSLSGERAKEARRINRKKLEELGHRALKYTRDELVKLDGSNVSCPKYRRPTKTGRCPHGYELGKTLNSSHCCKCCFKHGRNKIVLEKPKPAPRKHHHRHHTLRGKGVIHAAFVVRPEQLVELRKLRDRIHQLREPFM